MASWTTILLGILAIATIHYAQGLYRHLRHAQRTGLPYIVAPYPNGLVAMLIFESSWIPHLLDKVLPVWLADIIRDPLTNYRWTIKNRLHQRLGGVYLIVTPNAVICSVADAAVVSQIVNARNEFPKPVWQYRVIEFYGPNLITCEDKEWAHHRRHTASTFNERNNQLVWAETIRQTTEMLLDWKETCPSPAPNTFTVTDLSDNLTKFSLNVISGAGFGVQIPFKPAPAAPTKALDSRAIFQDTPSPPPGFTFTFRSVVAYTDIKIRSVVFANLILPRWIPRVCVPFLRLDFDAHRDLRSYLQRLIAVGAHPTTDDNDKDGLARENLIEGMLASRTKKEDAAAPEPSGKDSGLSDREIISNMHAFTLAGHETTETSLRFAFVLLALHQDVQQWMYEGIIDATRGEEADDDPAQWDYASLFPKLVTPLCVMLEIMRLYPPVVTVPKWTGSTPSHIHYSGRSILLSPDLNINLNMNGLHYSTEYWGADAEQFSPVRWDATNHDSFLARNADLPGLTAPGLEYRTVHRPVRGAYIPFSDGFRACLGKKFAQVEVVAALAVVFRLYRVRLVAGEGAVEQARRALEGSVSVVTLGMVEEVPLVFERR
ncbi:hypothetical protein FE257_001213 [Aspergillus nanangensis]|uniref:Cytochrome P450 monooxygenase n=1 Tax=Aspergillus nanangensis TaxID=2582783 RepID=A0AAD4CEE8_ASPNN|nr:hypothetical protein FE257_001213 [Aspergillus nanangensis]